MDKTNSDHARLIAALKRRAEKQSDKGAAKFLLEEFVNHSDAIERAKTIPLSDRLVVRFLARAVREILDGVLPTKALCLDASGRPEVPMERDLALAVRVHGKYLEFKGRAKEAEGGAVAWAIGAVSRQWKVPKPTVQKAWKRFGGSKGVGDLLRRIEEG